MNNYLGINGTLNPLSKTKIHQNSRSEPFNTFYRGEEIYYIWLDRSSVGLGYYEELCIMSK